MHEEAGACVRFTHTPTHTHTHTHPHTRQYMSPERGREAHTHTHTQGYTHPHTHTPTQTYTHTHKHKKLYTHTHTDTDEDSHTHTRAQRGTRGDTHTHTHTDTSASTHTQANTHTDKHTHTHTHNKKHTHTPPHTHIQSIRKYEHASDAENTHTHTHTHTHETLAQIYKKCFLRHTSPQTTYSRKNSNTSLGANSYIKDTPPGILKNTQHTHTYIFEEQNSAKQNAKEEQKSSDFEKGDTSKNTSKETSINTPKEISKNTSKEISKETSKEVCIPVCILPIINSAEADYIKRAKDIIITTASAYFLNVITSGNNKVNVQKHHFVENTGEITATLCCTDFAAHTSQNYVGWGRNKREAETMATRELADALSVDDIKLIQALKYAIKNVVCTAWPAVDLECVCEGPMGGAERCTIRIVSKTNSAAVYDTVKTSQPTKIKAQIQAYVEAYEKMYTWAELPDII